MPLALAALAAALVALGGPAQIARSVVYVCGWLAPETLAWVGAALAQSALYLLARERGPVVVAYRVTQYAVLAIAATQAALLALAYPQSAAVLTAVACGPALLALRLAGASGRAVAPPFVAVAALACTTAIVVAGGLLQYLLYRPHGVLPLWAPAGVWLAGAAAGTLVAWQFVRRGGGVHARGVADWLPASLLLLPLLRAKYPDQAFDTFLYKGTNPLQFADWGTAATAILDHTTLGTAFGEIAGTALRLASADYSPSLISTVAYIVLYALLPAACRWPSRADPAVRTVRGLAALSLFALTEAGIAQGTSYNEPLVLALLVAALVPSVAWPLFAAATIAVKLTAVFAVPFVVLAQARTARPDARGIAQLGVAALVGAAVLGGQLGHNLQQTGRLLGITDHFATFTDPPGPERILSAERVTGDDTARYGGAPRGGIARNLALASCNLLALDLLCAVHDGDLPDHGFHVLPGSRAALFALLLATALVATSVAGRRDRLWAVGSAALAWAVALAFLSAFAQGRYFLVLGFLFGALLLLNAPLLESAWRRLRKPARAAVSMLALLLVAADLAPGVMTNVGWDCRRALLDRPLPGAAQAPKPEDAFLRELAGQYRARCPAPGVSPTVVVEIVDDRLPPYVGLHRVQPKITWPMNERLFLADPSRRAGVPEAVIAIAYRSAEVAAAIAAPHPGAYEQCFARDGLTIMCSTALAPRGDACARSIVPALRDGPR